MGEAKKKRELRERAGWRQSEVHQRIVNLYMLPPVAPINGQRMKELTGDDSIQIPDTTQILLETYKVQVGEQSFLAGFCIGDESGYSAIGIAVIERLLVEKPEATLHVVRVVHDDVAWDIVLRHLREFKGDILLFAFSDSDVYDAGCSEKYYSSYVRVFDCEGKECERLTAAQRNRILAQKAKILDRPPTKIYETNISQTEVPWVFRFVTPAGKEVRIAVWNGRRDYIHQISPEFLRSVGGNRIAIVQVETPVGVNLRSSLKLTHFLSTEFDAVIHWARNSDTFESILRSFIRLDLESVGPPELPDGWVPEVVILAANSSPTPDE